MRMIMRKMWRLPLQWLARRAVVAGRVRMVMAVRAVIVVMAVTMMVVMMVMIVVHDQKLVGLSMMALCLPSVPCATMEPSASTTTRTANSAVMSDVS